MPKKSLKQQIKQARFEHKQGTSHETYHAITGGTYIRDIVYGANDGIVTTFAIIAGVAGAGLASKVVLILGFTNLFADGLSMAIGNYLGIKSELEYAQRERDMEKWEIDNIPDLEKKELAEIYRKKGFKGKDLTQAVNIIASDKKVWLDTMMVEELGLIPDTTTSPVKHGLVTLFSFAFAGVLPLFPYIFSRLNPYRPFDISIIFTAISLFTVGALRTFITKKHWFISGLEMFAVGAIAALAAYFVGYFIDQKFL